MMDLHNRKVIAKSGAFAAISFYMLIAFEFFYMAAPFASYLYAAYLPGLDLLLEIPALAWLVDFYLPHFAPTSCLLINSAMPVGLVLTSVGVVGFFWGAAQIYSRKLSKKGLATLGMYRYVRHPQYSALILAGFGMLLVWPRFLMVLFFNIMLLVYYFLAGREERKCEAKYGNAYSEYARQTPAFIPFVKLGLNRTASVACVRIKKGVLFTLWVLVSFGTAFLMRHTTVNHFYIHSDVQSTYLSLIEIEEPMLKELARNVSSDPKVKSTIDRETRKGKVLINYVMPRSWAVAEIPMRGGSGHITPSSYHPDQWKVVFTSAETISGPHSHETRRLEKIHRVEPVLEAWIDMTGRVERLFPPTANPFYGAAPVPIF